MKSRPLGIIAAFLIGLCASHVHAAPVGRTQDLTTPDQVPEGLAKSDWQSIRAAYEAGRYAFQPTVTGWQARNPGQQWTTKFDGRGFIAEPKAGGWQWGLELKSYGFAGRERTIEGTPTVKAAGTRLTYQWDSAVQEWFVNDERGLEHGFTIKERPAAPLKSQPSTLNFLLATRGTLHPRVAADAQGVLFQDAAGATVLNYTGLKVWDADGKVLASYFAPAEGGVWLLVDERGARYPLTIDPIAQQAYLKPAAVGTSQAGDQFGFCVAVSGNTVVVGAHLENSSSTGVNSPPNENALYAGAAYVFVRSAGVWTQQAYLKPAAVGTTQVGDEFGISVAVSGDTVVVGAYFEDSNTTGVNSTPNDNTNNSTFNSGAAYVFVRSGTNWTQQAYLKPAAVGTSHAGDNFGKSVAVSGDTVVVGAYLEDSSTTVTPNEGADSSGAAYVFTRSAGVWTQQAYLKPAAVGTTQAGDHFGASVAVSGDTVVVGADLEDSNTTGVNKVPDELATASGAAYVFLRSGTTWTQQAYLKPFFVGAWQTGDRFGCSVAVSGDTVAVGAYLEDSSGMGVNTSANESATDSGAAYIFLRSGTNWTQQAYLKPAAVGSGGGQQGDEFGISVAVSGDTVVVGAHLEDSSSTGVNSPPNENALNAGAAYVFVRSGTNWTQQEYLKPAAVGTTQAGDEFGISVAVSGDTVFVGAHLEDSNATGVNSTPNDTDGSLFNSGAAYVFAPFPTVISPTSAGLTSTTATLGGNVTGDGGATISGRGVVLARTATNPEPTIGGAAVTVVPTSGTTGVFTIPVSGLAPGTAYSFKAYAANAFGTAYSTVATFTTLAPEIAVEQPAGTDLTAGTATIRFAAPAGSPSAEKVFTIRNLGMSDLTITAPAVIGGHAGDFGVNNTGIRLVIPAVQQTTFSVTFTPTAGGTRSTTLRIPSDDPNENPFDIALTGTGLLITQDTDGDGLNDVAEYNLSALGFNWQVNQPALVSTLANEAESAGLYTTNQVQALNVGTPLLQKNPDTGIFTLTIGVQKSTTLLSNSFNVFPMNTPGSTTRINGAGELEFQFTVPDDAAFFRLEAK